MKSASVNLWHISLSIAGKASTELWGGRLHPLPESVWALKLPSSRNSPSPGQPGDSPPTRPHLNCPGFC